MTLKSKGEEKILIDEELTIEEKDDIEVRIAKAISRTVKIAEKKELAGTD